MDQTSSNLQNGFGFRARLLDLARRQRLFGLGARAVTIAAWWWVVVLGLILADAAWPMTVWTRMLWVAVLLVVAAVAVCVLWSKRTPGLGESDGLWAAQALERHGRLGDNQLVNAWWLLPWAEKKQAGLRGVLAQRSVAEAHRCVGHDRAEAAVDRRPWRRAWAGGAVVLAMWVVVLIAEPRFLWRQATRFIWPWGDRTALVATALKAAALNESLTADETASNNVANHAPAGGHQAARHATVGLRALADRAQRLQSHAAALLARLGRDDHGLNATWFTQRQSHLDAQVKQFEQHRRLLEKNLRSNTQNPPPGLGNTLEQVADQLEQLMLVRVGMAPIQPADAGRGQPRHGSLGQPVRGWLADVRAASKQDQQTLDQARLRVEQAWANGPGAAGAGPLLASVPAALRRGRLNETVPSGTQFPDVLDAATQQAPPAYRQMVASYFQQLAQEQAFGPRYTQQVK